VRGAGTIAAFLSEMVTTFFLVESSIPASPTTICAEARSKNVELFSCEKVKLP
jgi:hypothetical protein